mmetsp:Transcript_46867/g.93307  ORF Transcript_46867/g.93307 Transcript_46867/m.93307 type:complete len:233 (-) Transcript_46867:1194-1892(-)
MMLRQRRAVAGQITACLRLARWHCCKELVLVKAPVGVSCARDQRTCSRPCLREDPSAFVSLAHAGLRPNSCPFASSLAQRQRGFLMQRTFGTHGPRWLRRCLAWCSSSRTGARLLCTLTSTQGCCASSSAMTRLNLRRQQKLLALKPESHKRSDCYTSRQNTAVQTALVHSTQLCSLEKSRRVSWALTRYLGFRPSVVGGCWWTTPAQPAQVCGPWVNWPPGMCITHAALQA